MRLLLIILSCIILSCENINNKEPAHVKKATISSKDSILAILIKSYKNKNYKEFIACFPEDYKSINEIYGFVDTIGKAQLYDESYNHVTYLFNYPSGFDSVLYEKVINIAANLEWEPDVINYIQNDAIKLIISDPLKFVQFLNKRSKSESQKVWHFIIDGSSPNDLQSKQKYHTLHSLLKNIDPHQADILQKKYSDLYKHKS